MFIINNNYYILSVILLTFQNHFIEAHKNKNAITAISKVLLIVKKLHGGKVRVNSSDYVKGENRYFIRNDLIQV